MTKNRRRVFQPALLIVILVIIASAFVAIANLRHSRTAVTNTGNSQTVSNPSTSKRGAYVRRSQLSPRLVWNLKALGDRIEKPGRERLRAIGTLSQTNDSQTAEVVALWEFPGQLSLTMRKGNETRVLTFNEDEAKSEGNPLDAAERDLIETLVYGSAEHFFTTQMQGKATRFLGSRFRIDDGSTADYSGPFYDVYKVAERIKSSGDQSEQSKLYYFNSETLLLERVTYEINRNGSTVKVEERLSGWIKEQGQQAVRRIERFENAESVFVFTMHTVGLSARANDGVFAN